MIKKSICIVFILLVVILVLYGYHVSKKEVIPSESGNLSVYFCPEDNCEGILLEKINQSSTIHCAFYDIGDSVFDALQKKYNDGADVQLILEKDNAVGHHTFVYYDTRSAYMHNKFCIFDDVLMTGSMNPTYNGMFVNTNNLVFIESEYLMENYEAEFDSYLSGNFGWDKEVEYRTILFNSYVVENYFCPEDQCEERILDVLSLANESIIFMQFSFTSDVIGDLLVEKHLEDVEIIGVFEKQQKSQWSEYQKLLDAGIHVSYAMNDGKMHHKVFIVDKKIVVFGSMNPSKNGNEKNDENVVIVHDEEVAGMFVGEFYGQ
jgi:phosphatidylserine/phosphatidylglycerophosphate/cardiolipin synthase-like enzyme